MWPDIVVIGSPLPGRLPRNFEAGEPVQLQAVAAELAFKTIHERILCGFAGLDIDVFTSVPEEHRPGHAARPGFPATDGALKRALAVRPIGRRGACVARLQNRILEGRANIRSIPTRTN